tara:strand:+ start:8392 stop:10119 length:1728 start_codon:yes stop_codon:yes gene_type:complete
MLTKKYLIIFLSTLEKKQKYYMILFAVFIFVLSFLESFGLGMFYPFIQSVTNNEINPHILEFYNSVKTIFNFKYDFQVLSILIVAMIIIVKNIFSYYFEYWQLTFLNDLRISLKKKLLKVHFNNDYEISSNIKMSTYIRDFNNTIETFVLSFQTLIQLFIEVTIFFGIIILLLIIQSKQIIFFSITLSFVALLIFYFLKKMITLKGSLHLELQDKSLKKLIDILNSTKEIIVFDKSNFFTKQFISIDLKTLNNTKFVNLIQKFPKYFFESVVIICFVIFIFFAKSSQIDLNELLPELSIIFLALIKLLPGLTKILFHSQKLNFADKATTKISEDIKIYNRIEKEEKTLRKINFSKSIELKNIHFKYKNRDNIILENMNFKINKGDFIGIYGESGGGKSTLLSILTGFLKPSKGEILVDDLQIEDLKYTDWMKKVSYLTQENNLIDESILKNITLEFDNSKIDFDFFEKVCEQSGLSDFIKQLPDKYDTEIGQKAISISGGERQRIGVARSLYAKKEFLIFDESTVNLDEANKMKFVKTINNLSKDKTILLISHDHEVIKNCKKKFIIKDKSLIQV